MCLLQEEKDDNETYRNIRTSGLSSLDPGTSSSQRSDWTTLNRENTIKLKASIFFSLYHVKNEVHFVYVVFECN